MRKGDERLGWQRGRDKAQTEQILERGQHTW